MDIISLPKAKSQGLSHYFTGNPCKHGHLCQRKVLDRCCIECRKRISSESNKRFRENNPEKQRQRARESYQRHKEAYKRRARQWEQDNPERAAELQREWRRSEKGKKQSRNWTAANRDAHYTRTRDWKSRNPGKVNEYTGTRRAARIRSTPIWLTKDDRATIRSFYIDAKSLEQATETKHHVDHIIPLQNETVCGLHVPWNLQILTESENAAKSNKFVIDFLNVT